MATRAVSGGKRSLGFGVLFRDHREHVFKLGARLISGRTPSMAAVYCGGIGDVRTVVIWPYDNCVVLEGPGRRAHVTPFSQTYWACGSMLTTARGNCLAALA